MYKGKINYMNDYLIVKGARENNLKNIDLKMPRNKLVVFTGLSGSGKSTLAFETIYAEVKGVTLKAYRLMRVCFLDKWKSQT